MLGLPTPSRVFTSNDQLPFPVQPISTPCVMVSAKQISAQEPSAASSPAVSAPALGGEQTVLSKIIKQESMSEVKELQLNPNADATSSAMLDLFGREDVMLKIMAFCKWQDRLRSAAIPVCY